MKRMKLKCHLVSDVILNQSAATEGVNGTLDFIPGNAFLGIVASHYADYGDSAWEVFHSGRVRFGDAHPVCGDVAGRELRTLHVPASLYYPKMKSAEEVCYVHHAYDRGKDHENNGSPQQLKQCREGFYAFLDGKGLPAGLERSLAIKSAYDRKARRALDEKMFGYESLDAGADFYFDVEVDNEALADRIRQDLTGVRHIGRSRSAQYGTVEISECDYKETPSRTETMVRNGGCIVTVYADGRLIFLDGNGEPTFQPTAADLGIEGGEIDWMASQIRTFQYAPWNGKRMTREQERCGIEKGSVFVVKVATGQELHSQYVGSFRNEGFGKVIYNPEFLEATADNGKARYCLCGQCDAATQQGEEKNLAGTTLLDYIASRRRSDLADRYIYERVNSFVEENKGRYKGVSPSQWGAIRTIAMKFVTHDKIVWELFDKKETKTRTKENKEGEEPKAYLTHGVAEVQWKKYGRRETLQNFVKSMHDEGMRKWNDDIVGKALVNLASEMAKMAQSR